VDERKKRGSDPPATVAVSRTVTPDDARQQRHPIGTPRGLSPTVLAVAAWASERGIVPPTGQSWRVDVCLDAIAHSAARVFAESIDTRFRLLILPDEWAYYFCHARRVSEVRVTDCARSTGRDEHNLTAITPQLKKVGTLVRQLEQRFGVTLSRSHAVIETSLAGSEPIIRAWVMAL
jgi:hypothetical protein